MLAIASLAMFLNRHPERMHLVGRIAGEDGLRIMLDVELAETGPKVRLDVVERGTRRQPSQRPSRAGTHLPRYWSILGQRRRIYLKSLL